MVIILKESTRLREPFRLKFMRQVLLGGEMKKRECEGPILGLRERKREKERIVRRLFGGMH
jgi:hypothetical protein